MVDGPSNIEGWPVRFFVLLVALTLILAAVIWSLLLR